MKYRALLLLVAIVSGLAGMAIERWNYTRKHVQQSSSAGQTLVDLSRALEKEKRKEGKYPDSISNLNVQSDYNDFSEEMLKETFYYKTETGYIAFVGRPNVAYIYPEVSTQYKQPDS